MLWQKIRSPDRASLLGVRKEIQSFEHRENKTTFYHALAKDKKPNGSERASVQGKEIRNAIV